MKHYLWYFPMSLVAAQAAVDPDVVSVGTSYVYVDDGGADASYAGLGKDDFEVLSGTLIEEAHGNCQQEDMFIEALRSRSFSTAEKYMDSYELVSVYELRNFVNRYCVFHQVVASGHIRLGYWLLDHKMVDLARLDHKRQSPFDVVCKVGAVPLAKWLLDERNIDVARPSVYYKQVLFTSCEEGHTDLVRFLLTSNLIPVGAVDSLGNNVLHIACKNNDLDMVKCLLQYEHIGANVPHGRHGGTPFFIACYYKHTEVVRYLLAHGHIDVRVVDILNRTPLAVACESDCIPLVKLLLCDERIDMETPNMMGLTPFALAKSKPLLALLKSDPRMQALMARGKHIVVDRSSYEIKDGWVSFVRICGYLAPRKLQISLGWSLRT